MAATAVAATTARGGHHSQAVVASGRVGSSLLERCVFTPSCFVDFAFVGSFWSSSAIFFDPLGLKNTCSIRAWCLQSRNLQKPLKTSETTHNRRNRGKNCITIHFKPLK